MFPETVDNFLPLAVPDILVKFLEGNVNDVVMMKFFGRDFIAEFQPDSVEQIDFLAGQARCVRTEIKDMLLAGR